jgi:16S rRNA (guanine527-N7)-methyltransferase
VSLEEVPQLVEAAVQVLPAAARPEDLETLLCGYLAHLLERNLEVNLVSRKDTLRHVERFTRESLFLAGVLIQERSQAHRSEKPPRLLDIGSGGGFPGIVLKLAIPDLDIQLVEATRKKARFLADVAAGLDLHAAKVIWARSEELDRAERLSGEGGLRHRFDWVTGKGLGSISETVRLAEPFLRVEGVHWTFKGSTWEAELDAASGLFRQRGFTRHRVEKMPEHDSWVVGIRRLRP